MIKFIKNWQGAMFAPLSWLMFKWYGLSAGAEGSFTMGYYQVVILGIAFFFAIDFAAWLVFQANWKIFNRYIDPTDVPQSKDDSPHLQYDWDDITPLWRILICFTIIGFLFALCFGCVWLVVLLMPR